MQRAWLHTQSMSKEVIQENLELWKFCTKPVFVHVFTRTHTNTPPNLASPFLSNIQWERVICSGGIRVTLYFYSTANVFSTTVLYVAAIGIICKTHTPCTYH